MPLTVRAPARFLLAVVLCSLIQACGDAPAPEGKAPSAAPSASKTAQLPPEMVAAVAAGKTASAIGVHFALKNVPAVGQTLQADIAMVPHQPFELVRARFEPQDGMVISGGREFEPQRDIKAEQVLSHRIVLEPKREGILMVTAAVETEGTEGSTVRIFSIPVIVHAPSATNPVAAQAGGGAPAQVGAAPAADK